MTDDELLFLLRSEAPMEKARRKFTSWCGRIEQAGQQRKPLSPVELRKMEFMAITNIAATFGVLFEADGHVKQDQREASDAD